MFSKLVIRSVAAAQGAARDLLPPSYQASRVLSRPSSAAAASNPYPIDPNDPADSASFFEMVELYYDRAAELARSEARQGADGAAGGEGEARQGHPGDDQAVQPRHGGHVPDQARQRRVRDDRGMARSAQRPQGAQQRR